MLYLSAITYLKTISDQILLNVIINVIYKSLADQT